jgi:hypothetical protein
MTMVLKIKTFANQKPCTFFKALGHPLIMPRLDAFKKLPLPAIYDPEGHLDDFLAMTTLPSPSRVYVQAVEALEPKTSLISEIQTDKPEKLLILSFEPEKHLGQIGPLLSPTCEIISLKPLRLPDEMLTDSHNYLSDLNFSTNFVFFREEGGWHTHLQTANYWAKYGSQDVKLWAILFDGEGQNIAQWEETLSPTVHSFEINSQNIKHRFKLPDFTGQLFIHLTGTKGHSIVKYALDTFHDAGMVSSTHDANAWPSAYFAGLPAPRAGEKVILWLQNSHPIPIPPQGISLNLMGNPQKVALDQEIPPFGSYPLDVGTFFPKACWPQQIELHAGHTCVRPRYEVVNSKGYRCIAHVNVERDDLKPDPKLKEATSLLGKGFILPAPVLPTDFYTTSILPTPMSRALHFMPLQAFIYNKEGVLKKTYAFGNLARHHITPLVLEDCLDLRQDYGHVELTYDFKAGEEADGWLHGLFRYEHKIHPAQAETSFGSHIFNTSMTYKNEPQSYKGPPPGLTTSLFLRINEERETFCYLIYPASTAWHPTSDTKLILYTKEGGIVAESPLKIPQSGSRLWVYQDSFSPSDREKARGGYVMIQDKTCRLFGYHGLRHKNGNFSLDHMFGF